MGTYSASRLRKKYQQAVKLKDKDWKFRVFLFDFFSCSTAGNKTDLCHCNGTTILQQMTPKNWRTYSLKRFFSPLHELHRTLHLARGWRLTRGKVTHAVTLTPPPSTSTNSKSICFCF